MWSRLRVWDYFLDVLFPPLCLVCQQALDSVYQKRFICRDCISNIEVNSALTCPICRGRIGEIASRCHKNSDYLLAASSNYDDLAIKKLIWQLKFRFQKKASLALTAVILTHLEKINLVLDDYVVIPIPLFSHREKRRGFNQSALLASSLASHLSLVLMDHNLKRIRNTQPQVGLDSLKARRENVSGCFSLIYTKGVFGKKVLLIDDVFTTGSTMNEAARVLKKAGAKKIIGVVVAKA